MNRRKYIIYIFLLLFPFIASRGQELWPIQRLQGQINFDGMPFEKVWDQIKPFPMVMYQPDFGNQPSEKTEIRVTYDDHYIYISGRMYEFGLKRFFVANLSVVKNITCL